MHSDYVPVSERVKVSLFDAVSDDHVRSVTNRIDKLHVKLFEIIKKRFNDKDFRLGEKFIYIKLSKLAEIADEAHEVHAIAAIELMKGRFEKTLETMLKENDKDKLKGKLSDRYGSVNVIRYAINDGCGFEIEFIVDL